MKGFYLNRWKIEDYFRILKSGCRVEYLAFRTADRLSCAIAINAVIAWRIQLMTLLGREAPHNDPRLMFTDEEITFLRDSDIRTRDVATAGVFLSWRKCIQQ